MGSTIYKRGGIWWANVSHEGRRARITTEIRVDGGASRQRAQRRADAVFREVQSGQLVIEGGRLVAYRLSFEAFAEQYLQEHRDRLRPGTLEGVRTVIKDALPVLGNLPVRRISREDAMAMTRALKKAMRERGTTVQTIKTKLAYLQMMFSDAVEGGLLSTNPFANKHRLMRAAGVSQQRQGRRARGQNRKGKQPYSKEEVRLICANVRELDPYDRGVVFCGLWAGLRRSEALALKRDDLDLSDEPGIDVNSRYSRGEIDQPKTDTSDRWVEIPLELRDILLEAVVVQKRDVLEGKRPSLTKWVFPMLRQSGRDLPMDERAFEDRFTRFLRKIGVPAYSRPYHMLRHTYATALMMDCGVALPAVSKLLGHASIQTTVDDYGHLMSDAPRHTALAALARWHLHGHRHNFGHTEKDEGP